MMRKGDLGLFRSALMAAGFHNAATCTMFNDSRKGFATRRLKLRRAGDINDAPLDQQWHLERELRARFGKRIQTMYFLPTPIWNGRTPSLCIELANGRAAQVESCRLRTFQRIGNKA
jgi:hypothetical protein